MNNEDDIKLVCDACIGEAFLREMVHVAGEKRSCSYCQNVGQAVTLETIATMIERAFDDFYVLTPSQPEGLDEVWARDPESEYEWQRDGEPIIQAIENLAEVSEDIARDVQDVLSDRHGDMDTWAMGDETEFSSSTYYEEKSADDKWWQGEWLIFQHSLQIEARFFSESAHRFLASIFDGIDKLSTYNAQKLVIDGGPNTPFSQLFRARVFESSESLKIALERPDQHLGPPPPRLARAGRMNPHGIAVFYGANDPDIALAEVRPPVGSQVIVGTFQILRAVRLLDLTALDNVLIRGSAFDPTYLARLNRAKFLRSLGSRLTMPVMPNDEASKYLVTQAVADFLSARVDGPFDGIIYPSVQGRNGNNVALFHKASKVAEIQLPLGTLVTAELETMTADGPETEYTVYEAVSHESESGAQQAMGDVLLDFGSEASAFPSYSADRRTNTLSIDPQSLIVHSVKAIDVVTEHHSVMRFSATVKPRKF